MRNYTTNFWNTTMGQTINNQSSQIQQVLNSTASQVMPLMENIQRNVRQLENDNMATFKKAAANMRNNPLRDEIMQQHEEVKEGLMRGYYNLSRTLDMAGRKVNRAHRDYMRKMRRTMRSDERQDREIMNSLSR